MNRLKSIAVLVAAALFGSLPESAWAAETTATGAATPDVQTQAPPGSGGYVQTWQQPRPWPAPQYGQLPPAYPSAGQYQGYPAQPAAAPAAKVNPLSAELSQTQEQLAAKSSELDEARTLLDQLRGQLQDSRAAGAKLSDKMTYVTREQNALRVRLTELVKTVNACNATLEQQREMINDHQAQNRNLAAERDQLSSDLASRSEQLARLQSELQSVTQALAQASHRASAARDELTRLEAELQNLEDRKPGPPPGPTE